MKQYNQIIALAVALILTVLSLEVTGQSRWTKIFYEHKDAVGNCIIPSYDKGVLVTGKHGHNAVEYNWLIKTDINGNTLWEKTIGAPGTNIMIADMAFNNDADLFLVGLTGYYSEQDYDPLIMKLNACGEKTWCLVITEEDNNFASGVLATDDGGCIVLLNMMSADRKKDRICLSKLDDSGNMLWKHCYNTSDTNLYNGDAKEVIRCNDSGYLISGSCGYRDFNPPHYLWVKPYYIKTDSLGNFEWEKVLHSEGSSIGGSAWNSVVSPDSNSFYSSISHYYNTASGGDAPALAKLSLDGELIDIYDLAPPDDYGKMISAKFVTDTTLVASAIWGNGDQSSRAVIIDTLGNIIEQTMVLDNDWMGQVEITFDQKILYFTNLNVEDDFDAYLFKYNQNLESDSVYTQYFTYDSLCDGEIVSDTIVQDDCGLIVGMEEIYTPKSEPENKVIIYPNPAREKFKVQGLKFQVENCTVEVYDLYGRKVEVVQVPEGQTEVEIQTTGWKKGLYVVRVMGDRGLIGSGKVLVE